MYTQIYYLLARMWHHYRTYTQTYLEDLSLESADCDLDDQKQLQLKSQNSMAGIPLHSSRILKPWLCVAQLQMMVQFVFHQCLG